MSNGHTGLLVDLDELIHVRDESDLPGSGDLSEGNDSESAVWTSTFDAGVVGWGPSEFRCAVN